MIVTYNYMENTETLFPEAWEAAHRLKSKYDIQFEFTPRDDDYSQYRYIQKYWGRDDLIVVDRSIVITEDLMDELIACPRRVCCHWFRSGPGWIENTISIGCRLRDPLYEMLFRYQEGYSVQGGEYPEWVTFSGFGFAKLGKEFQKEPLEPWRITTRKPPNEPLGNWINADNAIIQNINRWMTRDHNAMLAFHVHRECRHTRDAASGLGSGEIVRRT